MKIYLASLLSLFLFYDAEPEQTGVEKVFLTCYGKTPCNACKSCNYCKYCTSGGTCGICTPVKGKVEPQKSKTPTSEPSSPGQCKAKTKKGTRCSRNIRSKGYCWQHGG